MLRAKLEQRSSTVFQVIAVFLLLFGAVGCNTLPGPTWVDAFKRGDVAAGYQDMVEEHREIVKELGATPIREDVGETCFDALQEFYDYYWLKDILILRNSPIMELQPKSRWAMMIEGVIHVRKNAPLPLAHEIRHWQQQRTMGITFWPAYLGAHAMQGYEGNWMEMQARESQKAFNMQHPNVC